MAVDMDATDLCFAGAAAQADLVRAGEVSALELTTAVLERIATVDPDINSYRHVLAEEALSAARAIDARAIDAELPLRGVPVAVKDTVGVAGLATGWGTNAVDGVEPRDSPIVATLREAGAVIIGVTTCSELAVWPFTEPPATGATRNPWDPAFSPGGSSGGSGAAVAAGLCGVAIGSDGLGSIRVPASFNGVFGIKPQRGRVWHGDGDWNGLSVNGPLCRTVADAALFLDVTAIDSGPHTFRHAIAAEPDRLRIAVAFDSAAPWPMAARLGPSQRGAVEDMADLLRGLGHDVVDREVGFPMTMSHGYVIRYLTGVEDSLGRLDRPEDIETRTRRMATLGRLTPERARRWAIANGAKAAAKVARVFDDVDIVLTPGAAARPLRVGELDGKGAVQTLYRSGRRIPHFAPWNTVGQPAASVPAGLSPDGLPISVQLAGRPGDEATLLALSAQLEAARPWADARPPV